MKKFLLLAIATFLTAQVLQAKDRDTTFIKRPYYLGITAGYSRFGNSAKEGTPFDMMNLPRSNQMYEELYYDRSMGIELAFPFLRRWECEMNLEFMQTFGWRQYCVYHEKNNPPPLQITWYAGSHNTMIDFWRLRSFFSYELLRKGKFALNAGAGGWYSTQPKVGAESGLKCYYAMNKDFTLQLAVNAGYSAFTKLYGAVHISVLMTGTRTYRARPDYYYIRTYED